MLPPSPAPTTLRPLLSVRLLGFPAVELGGHPLPPLRYDKLKALLGILGRQPGRPCERSWIARTLWPDRDQSAAMRSLRNTLTDLRRALRHDLTGAIDAKGETVCLLVDGFGVDSDTRQLDATMDSLHRSTPTDPAKPALLERVIALLQGSFLEGVELDGNRPFEEWVTGVRHAMQAQRTEAFRALVAHHIDAGTTEEAVRVASRWLAAEPHSECAHRALVHALAVSGRERAAVEQYHRCLAMLREQYGAKPSADTTALYTALAAGQFSHLRRPADSAQPLQPPERRRVAVLCASFKTEHGEGDLRHTALAETLGRLTDAEGGQLHHRANVALAYFGIPAAADHPAQQARRVALGLLAQAGAKVSIGLHCDIVVTRNDAAPPDATGRAARTAYLLARRGVHGQCLVSPAAAASLPADSVESPPGSPAESADAPVFRLVRNPSVSLDRPRQQRPLAFIGRDAEIARIETALKQACEQRPQWLLIEGEAGIGKTRLLREACVRLGRRNGEIRRIELDCKPTGTGSPFDPLWTWARHRSVAVDAAAEQMEQAWLAVLKPGPADPLVLLTVEDLQWADASTLRLLERLHGEVREGKLLVLATVRACAPSSTILPFAERLPLQGLAREDCETFRRQLAPAVDPRAVARLYAHTGGNPLFLELLTTQLQAGQTETGADPPATISQLIMRRLDGAAEAKEIAQVAAVLGSEFSVEDLVTVAGADPDAVVGALHGLRAQGLVETADGQRMRFTHELVRETAYESQLLSVRKQRHLRVARHLESRRARGEVVTASLLASHFKAGDKLDQAARHARDAATDAIRCGADHQADLHLREVLQCLERLAPAERPPGAMFEARTELALVLLRTEGMSSAAARRLLDVPADESTRDGAAPLARFKAMWADWLSTATPWTCVTAWTRAERLMHFVDGEPACEALRCYVYYAISISCWLTARFEEGMRYARLASCSSVAVGDAMRELLVSHPRVLAGCVLSLNAQALGDASAVAEGCEAALDFAAKSGHSLDACTAATIAAFCHAQLGDYARAAVLASQAEAAGTREGRALWPSWLNTADILAALSAAKSGRPEQAHARLREAERRGGILSTTHELMRVYWAEAWLACGRTGPAMSLLETALANANTFDHVSIVPEARRTLALCWEHAGAAPEEAVRLLKQAVQEAARIGAPLSRMRCATEWLERCPTSSEALYAASQALVPFTPMADHQAFPHLMRARQALRRNSSPPASAAEG